MFRIAKKLFGGSMEPTVDGGRQPQLDHIEQMAAQQPIEPSQAPQAQAARPAADQPTQSAQEAVDVLERTIEHFESVLGSLEQQAKTSQQAPGAAASLRSELTELLGGLEHGLALLSSEARRLSDEAANLAAASNKLESRIGDLGAVVDSTASLTPVTPAGGSETEQPIEDDRSEPQFWQDDQPVGIVIAAVPGFQGLMDVQRGIGTLAAVESASVVGYKNGEAILEVALREPVSAREVVEGLHQATGHRLVIEEARPDALRLRLRFVDSQESPTGGSLRSEFRTIG
jgi:hypothetical protein